MSAYPSIPLGSCVLRVETWNPLRAEPDEEFRYIDLSAVDQDTKSITEAREIACADAPSRARQLVRTGDVLVSTVRPNLNGVARVPDDLDGATASTGFCVLRPDPEKLSGSYLFHWVKSVAFVGDMVSKATGASYPAVSDRIIFESLFPLPPLQEQRRIASILDQAETLRTQRRTALALLDSLTQSLFLDMFGDPVANLKGWDAMQFGNGIATSLRNGLSPSTDGKVMAKVLTLSAITGESFNPDAWKLAPFHTEPPTQQAVDENDFLICRGNGNVKLVGKGYFPSRSFTDVTFPDTIIAARINGQNIKREYLQFIWNSKAVRLQIEALARTTNGTFKVNQTMLERIQIPVPPLPLQQTFATRIASIEALKATHRHALAALDALFASLQQRAFAGQL